MMNYQTSTIHRGAQIWPKNSLMLGPGFLFFDRQLKVFGPNIIYSLFPEKDSSIHIDFGVRYFDDNKPLFYFGHHNEDYRNQRKNSLESYTSFSYNFGFKKKFSIGFSISKELIDYEGLYSELKLGAPIAPFTSLSALLSFAEKSSNQYLYGNTAISGVGYSQLGTTIVIPFVPWDGIIINQLNYSWIIKDTNKNADYIRGNDRHWVFSTRWIWKVF